MSEKLLVEVINDCTDYAKQGIHKGDKGFLFDDIHRGSKWLVKFPIISCPDEFKEIYVEDEDLGCIFFK